MNIQCPEFRPPDKSSPNEKFWVRFFLILINDHIKWIKILRISIRVILNLSLRLSIKVNILNYKLLLFKKLLNIDLLKKNLFTDKLFIISIKILLPFLFLNHKFNFKNLENFNFKENFIEGKCLSFNCI